MPPVLPDRSTCGGYRVRSLPSEPADAGSTGVHTTVGLAELASGSTSCGKTRGGRPAASGSLTVLRPFSPDADATPDVVAVPDRYGLMTLYLGRGCR